MHHNNGILLYRSIIYHTQDPFVASPADVAEDCTCRTGTDLHSNNYGQAASQGAENLLTSILYPKLLSGTIKPCFDIGIHFIGRHTCR